MYFLIIVAAIAVYVIMTRNKFNELQQMIKNGVSDIGVQSEALDRTLDKLIDIARNGYQKEIEGIAQLTAKDKLDRLLFLGQKYPDLKSIGEYSAIARKSEMLDKNLTAARQLVNGNIREYNTAINNFLEPSLHLCLVSKKKRSLMRKITKRINHLKEETWILQNNFDRINQSDSEYGCVYMSDWHRREI